MNPELLLQKISDITKKETILNQKTGRYFNIFNMTQKTENEVFICQVLRELLSPAGSHFQGNLYPKLFVKHVLQLSIAPEDLSNAKVYQEYIIDENRRIDLVIETSSAFIPIEVKIHAKDQPNQCYDYYEEAKKHVANPKLYYLTRLGDIPSEDSAAGLTKIDDGYAEIQTISFAEDILDWLNLCARETLQIAPIREVVLQLMSAIRQFTDQMEEELEMEIKELLISSSENMRSAIAIQNSLVQVKETIIEKLFTEIHEKVGRERLLNEYDYAFSDCKHIHDLYKRSNPAYFGISYLYKSDVKKNVDIWVRLAIEVGELYIGYCCPVKQKEEEQVLSEKEIKAILNIEPKVDSWWAYWEMCPNENDCPDFLDMNDAYYNLFDKEYFDKVVGVCAERILSLLNHQMCKLSAEEISSDIKPVEYTSNDELKNMKIGMIARTVLREMLENGKVSKEEIIKMQTQEYSKETFDLQFPLLLKANNASVKSPKRYYASPLQIYGEKYYLCSEWFEVPANNDRPYLLKWLVLRK